ncbi:MAG: hypothetical protein WCL08_03925 [Verrucomicrobiota bacterium]
MMFFFDRSKLASGARFRNGWGALAVCFGLSHGGVVLGQGNGGFGADPSASGGFSTEIKPPFNLSWGETSDRLERLVVSAGGKVISRHPARGAREAIEVTGLPQEGLKKTIFYFKLGALTGVELQYHVESWPEEKYGAVMSDLRGRISKHYGEGQQIARRTEKLENVGVVQTVTGYKWSAGAANVQLVYFSAADAQNAFRTVSVHYNAF